MRDTLVFLEYLDSHIIPVAGFAPDNISSFEKLLASLSPEDRRKVNRKFRKIFRQIAKRATANRKKPTEGWAQVYGIGSPKPNKRQLRARRRLVHEEIQQVIQKRIDDA